MNNISPQDSNKDNSGKLNICGIKKFQSNINIAPNITMSKLNRNIMNNIVYIIVSILIRYFKI